jgi:hypothetical protein
LIFTKLLRLRTGNDTPLSLQKVTFVNFLKPMLTEENAEAAMERGYIDGILSLAAF